MFVMGSLLGLLVAAGAAVGMLPATSTPLHDDAPDAEEAQAGTSIEPLPDDAAAADITTAMLVAAAEAIANCVSAEELNPSYIVPSVFDARVAPAVAEAVAGQAGRS